MKQDDLEYYTDSNGTFLEPESAIKWMLDGNECLYCHPERVPAKVYFERYYFHIYGGESLNSFVYLKPLFGVDNSTEYFITDIEVNEI